MPRTRPLGPPPDERPNWGRLNEGQRRYAWEQYLLARVRRGLPIDHPIVGGRQPEEQQAGLPEEQEVDPVELLTQGEQGPADWVPDEEEVEEVEQYQVPDRLPMSTPMQVDEVASTSGVNRTGAKKRKMVEGTSLPGTAGAQGGGGGGIENAVERIPRPMYHAHKQIRHFRK